MHETVMGFTSFNKDYIMQKYAVIKWHEFLIAIFVRHLYDTDNNEVDGDGNI